MMLQLARENKGITGSDPVFTGSLETDAVPSGVMADIRGGAFQCCGDLGNGRAFCRSFPNESDPLLFFGIPRSFLSTNLTDEIRRDPDMLCNCISRNGVFGQGQNCLPSCFGAGVNPGLLAPPSPHQEPVDISLASPNFLSDLRWCQTVVVKAEHFLD